MNHIKAEDRYSVLSEKVMKDNIDFVLCGGLSPMWRTIKKVFDTCKSAKSTIITIGGGRTIYVGTYWIIRISWCGLCSYW